MFDTLKAVLNSAKDSLAQSVAPFFIHKFGLKRLGTMSTFRIDSAKKEIFIELDLHGEATPIELTIGYELPGSSILEIKHVSSSREWIATLVNDMIPPERKQIKVPGAVASALSKLIK